MSSSTIDEEQRPSSASSSTNEKAQDEESARSVHGFKWVLVCISLYLSAFLYGLDTTIAADIQGAVVETFGGVGELTWIGTGFPLGSVSATLAV